MALLAGRRAGADGRAEPSFFSGYAPEKLPYAIDRYVNETNRLYGVLDRQLAKTRDSGGFIAGAYSIADIASYPWVVPWKAQGQDLDDFPDLRRWFDAIRARPAVERAYELGPKYRPEPTMSEEDKKVLFGQTAAKTAALADGKGAAKP